MKKINLNTYDNLMLSTDNKILTCQKWKQN